MYLSAPVSWVLPSNVVERCQLSQLQDLLYIVLLYITHLRVVVFGHELMDHR